jgi:aldehyde dehydrogenase (NAD+)
MLADCFYTSGVPKSALCVLDSSIAAAKDAMERGVDFVVLTGSNSTGRKIAAKAAEKVVPCVLELSGCDACIVLPGADLQRVVAALRFGLMLNSGATCIGPRRILVQRGQLEPLEELLKSELGHWGEVQIHPAAQNAIIEEVEAAIREGACDLVGTWNERLLRQQGTMRPLVLSRVTREQSIARADLFGPLAMLMEVEDETEAIELVNDCPYGLAASLFGPHWEAERIAKQLRVGTVVINDLIVPTADPRLPFGGTRQSGYGVSRGPEGLLEMTQPRVVCVRRGGIAPHLEPKMTGTTDILLGALALNHGSCWTARMAGLRRLWNGVRLSRKNSRMLVPQEKVGKNDRKG